jgi:hypothetical protein
MKKSLLAAFAVAMACTAISASASPPMDTTISNAFGTVDKIDLNVGVGATLGGLAKTWTQPAAAASPQATLKIDYNFFKGSGGIGIKLGSGVKLDMSLVAGEDMKAPVWGFSKHPTTTGRSDSSPYLRTFLNYIDESDLGDIVNRRRLLDAHGGSTSQQISAAPLTGLTWKTVDGKRRAVYHFVGVAVAT